jgi:hypothetical protein
MLLTAGLRQLIGRAIRIAPVGMLFALCLACAATMAAAQPVGEVTYAQGLTSLQRPGEEARFVQKGDALNQGDVISTSGRGFAVITLKDGTKFTLRPNTSFSVDKFNHGAGDESALFRLLKGGIRAVTGLISKRNPQGMQLTSRAATMGIRGTSFDVRSCEGDCAEELKAQRKKEGPPTDLVVARIAVAVGTVTVVAANGQTRPGTKGTPLVNGETVRTDKGGYAVIAFRDQSKVTVTSDSEFKLENVRFAGPKSDSGNFVVRVVRGGARALTGLLARTQPQNVQVHMLTAVVGVRGTGVDAMFGLDCLAPGQCADSAFVHTWEGAVALEVGGRSLLIELGQTGVFNPKFDRLTLIEQRPQFMIDEPAPRPDAVPVDFDNLFAVATLDGYPAGLYTLVHDGHIEFFGRVGSVDLGPGESAYLVDGGDTPVRLAEQPAFLVNDPYPQPDTFNEATTRVIEIENCEIR